MKDIQLFIPPKESFRAHLMIVLLYMEVFLKEPHLPSFDVHTVIQLNALMEFRNKLFYSAPDKDIQLNREEILLLYACTFCMTKVLLSKHDENILNKLTQILPQSVFATDEQQEGSFSNFRKNAIKSNVELLKETEEKLSASPTFQELKQKLEQIHID